MLEMTLGDFGLWVLIPGLLIIIFGIFKVSKIVSCNILYTARAEISLGLQSSQTSLWLAIS